jgi:hypothetical protein
MGKSVKKPKITRNPVRDTAAPPAPAAPSSASTRSLAADGAQVNRLRLTLGESAGLVTEAYRGPLVGLPGVRPRLSRIRRRVKSRKTRPGNRRPERALGVAALHQAGPKKKYFSPRRHFLPMRSVRIGMIVTTSGTDWPSVPRGAGQLRRPLFILRYSHVPHREHRSRTLCSVRMSSFRWWAPWGTPLVLGITDFAARSGWGGSRQERRI